MLYFFFFSSRRRHTRSLCDWSSDVCSSDLVGNWCGEIWFRDVDSNHDTQLQRLMSYRLDDPGTGPNSVADARKCPQARPIHDSYGRLRFRAIPEQPVRVIKQGCRMPGTGGASGNLFNHLCVEWTRESHA